jgi:acetylornithine/LysW-gamma-L-lysine aminotransferase
MGAYLAAELAAALGDVAREIRGSGLMLGIEVKRGANRVLRDLAIEHGMLALPAGRSVVRLLPPLVIGEDEADRAVDALAAALTGEASR